MLFDKVIREHILQGIKDFEKKGLPKGFGPSSTYDLLYEDKKYPPKAIMVYANYHAIGRKIERYFSGGLATDCFKAYEINGFEIILKSKITEMVNVKLEFANWILNNAPDSYTQYLGGSVNTVIERFNEINNFFPERKFFEVDPNNIQDLIEFIVFKLKKSERIKNIKFEKYDNFHSHGIPKAILGKNNYIKYLQERFIKPQNDEVNYWLFQGNPSIYDIVSALNNHELTTWSVKAHKDRIQIGDKVILWVTGKKSGCYALAEVSSYIFNGVDDAVQTKYYTDKSKNETSDRVRIKILYNFSSQPILGKNLISLKAFQDFKGGNQGTNFSATKEQYQSIVNLINKEKFSWVKTHKQLSKFLVDKENQQSGLIEILETAGATLFNDQDPKGKTFQLNEIDPFTFYCYIYKYGPETRLKILQNVAKSLSLFVPDDESGIPSTNPQRVWLFPYKYYRVNNEIKRLWTFYYAVMNKTITEKLFTDFLELRGVAHAKLTEALFYIDPENFFPINSPTKPYLEKVLEIDPKFNSFSEYKDILEQIKSKTDKSFYELSYEAWLWNDQLQQNRNIDSTITETMKENNTVLNKILFGPPGTGKTYNTINESLKIVDPEYYKEHKNDRKILNKRFKELLIKNWDNTTGQIAFCTFHQSFSYEDFVEGIKPKTNDKQEVYYEIEDGVFKKICQLADSSISAVKMKKEGKLSWNEEKFNRASFYKLSLGDSKKSEDKEIYEYCRDNNYISIGFGGGLDYSGMSESEIKEFCADTEELGETHSQQLNYFIHYLKVGNYMLISNGNKFVRALGQVTGEYEFDPNAPIRYNQFRKVEWIFKDENIPIEELYNRGFSQVTLYKIDEQGLKKEFFVNYGQLAEPETKKVKDYVLVIDEINRGNVSSIFGELITLIEKDKRAGADEELEVTLPYSKDAFKVPHNVFIVGTMNTADRSIEALDTALRRRFAFKEMPPKPYLIKTEGDSGKVNGIVDGINLKNLLETINTRIEKLIDKDHKIGHSYFLKVDNKKTLINCFKNEVIPLLEEYFFGDYGKIGLVLGDSFVTKDDTDAFEFAEFEGYDTDVSDDLKEKSVYKIRPSKDWDFNSI